MFIYILKKNLIKFQKGFRYFHKKKGLIELQFIYYGIGVPCLIPLQISLGCCYRVNSVLLMSHFMLLKTNFVTAKCICAKNGLRIGFLKSNLSSHTCTTTNYENY